ncbi:helix-turn-helix transcriptional regulator [Dactylosporangium sp. AC04546]|uniref:helix-turn-helix transcriptional regulator n=1 Tax=Dactylosporangium sp. AC04546 TaxID=2862460 RepID=UPI001EDE8EF7|nr:helix-turn-helix transcriptional regulator [Dactylosporangium sp. AC04546]WVK86745.1 helix-turn-helix transcriptional regulator [Dactylosporangium sp. AC04546]
MDHVEGVTDRLDDLTVTAYRQIVETGDWDDDNLQAVTGAAAEELDAVRRSLAALRVIEPSPDRGRGWTAVSPHVAMARLVSPIEADAHRRAAQAARLRNQLQRLVPVHEQSQHSRYGQALEVIGDEAALTDLLDDELSRSTSTVSVLEPGVERLPLAPYVDACEREVRFRAVHQHAVRYDPPATEFMKTLTHAGATFGTVDELPLRLFVFDGRTGVLITSDGPAAAVVVRQPLMVKMLAGLFDTTWNRAVSFEAADPQPTCVPDDVKRAILRLLATGAKDELVARRLGISVRTCRRYISEVMESIGATSRFQAGVVARASGLA